MQLFLFFSYVSLFALPASAQSSTQPTVTTLNGTYAGTFLPTFNQDFFGGIPYAQPSRRFVPAQSLNERFSRLRQASNYSVGCVGIGGDDIGYVQGEDCLTVNVIRPSGVKPGQGLPVLVWIHGGGYTMGSSDNIRYNGSFNVQRSVNMSKPMIFASFNYRLTAYGFPVGDEPTKAGILNLGLKDQRLALQWISENIAAFGGDPSKVTIQGESAGGNSVFQHMLAFGGRNDHLFRGGVSLSSSCFHLNDVSFPPVISESGYWAPLMASNRAAIYNATWNSLLSVTNCSDIACLQALPLSTFNASVARVGSGAFNPVVDGDFIKVDPAGQVSDGDFVKVPLIVGANSDEGTAFLTRGINFDSDFVNAILARNSTNYAFTSAADVQQILQLYPDDPAQGVPIGTGDGILSTGFQDKRSGAFFGDAVMVGPRRAVAQANAKGAATFSYRFNQPPYHFPMDVGATHFSEVAYVFNDRNNNTALPSNQPLGPRVIDAELALLMSSMWISFTHDQTPNNNLIPGAPVWPSYGPSGGQHIVFQGFGSGSSVENDNFREAGIAFINQKTAEVAKAL
ncbi:alpha/beta-hydrolase [Mycena metata]|uniref:Carboxylic ester hydrolase n=1 Tax=Mycena metata TaxID=1033252 RepID=A0AAD7JGD7_9AGAR|nr:alpha/beta-hydrolase [Mycena metata]